MTLLSLLKILHLCGLVMGLGGAVLADLTVLKHGVLRPVRRYTLMRVESLSRIVLAGLLILWISGLGIVKIRSGLDPNFLGNPKFWSKMVIVFILSVNGFALHGLILPRLKRRLGQRLFNRMPVREMALMTLVGAVSCVSWFTPFVLGVASELNFVTPASLILAAYFALVMGAWSAMFAAASQVSRLFGAPAMAKPRIVMRQVAGLSVPVQTWSRGAFNR